MQNVGIDKKPGSIQREQEFRELEDDKNKNPCFLTSELD